MKISKPTQRRIETAPRGRAFDLVWAPGRFFSQTALKAHWSVALVFLMASAAGSSVAALVYGDFPSPLITGGILFLNAMGTLCAGAVFSYLAAMILPGPCPPFHAIFSIYAFSGGLPLFISWLPGSFWVTQLWKWWLVGIGLTRSAGIERGRAMAIIGATIGLSLCFFWSLLMLLQ